MAWRWKPTRSGSVTATICMTPASRSRCARWRTAASDRPIVFAIDVYGRRPSRWSSRMICIEMASSRGAGVRTSGPSGLRTSELRTSELRISSSDTCATTIYSAKGLYHPRILAVPPSAPATDRTRGVSMQVVQNLVNGKPVDAGSGATTDLIDPCTGEVYGSAPVSSAADIDQAVEAANAAFEGWRATTPSERSLALLRIADALERDAERFVDAECRSTGKPK